MQSQALLIFSHQFNLNFLVKGLVKINPVARLYLASNVEVHHHGDQAD